MLLIWLACAPMHRVGANFGAGLQSSLVDENGDPKPELQAAAQALGQSLVGGALEGLNDEEKMQAIQVQVDALIAALGPQIAEALGEEVGPALQEQLSSAVTQTLAEIRAGQGKKDIEAIAAGISAAIVRGLSEKGGPALAAALKEDLGPALKVVLERDLNPVIQDQAPALAGEATKAASSALTAQLATDLNGPLGDALQARADAVVENARAAAETEGERWQSFFWSALVGIVVLLLGGGGLGYGLIRQLRQANGLRAALDLVTTNIKRSEAEAPIREMTQRIKVEGKDTAGGQALSEFLKERKHNKIELEEG